MTETAAPRREDFRRCGVEENRKAIEALARDAREQRLVSRRIAAEEFFARPTLGMSKI